MARYELDHADDPELDRLAEKFHLHPLHVEDCRTEGERIKSDVTPEYTFTILRTFEIAPSGDPVLYSICIFSGRAFSIVIADRGQPAVAQVLARAKNEGGDCSPGRTLYLIFDSVVDTYFAALTPIDEHVDELEDRVLDPRPELLREVFQVKRSLIGFRRLLLHTRDASMHLQRDPGSVIDQDHQLFLRDLYDHLARLLDSVESERDLLSNALDIYVSSLANRTNEVMKVLTALSTIALPALILSSIYGMNLKGLPFVDSPHAALIVAGMTAVSTIVLLVTARLLRWL